MNDELAIVQALGELISAQLPEEKARVVEKWRGTLQLPLAKMLFQRMISDEKRNGDPIRASTYELNFRFLETALAHGSLVAIAEDRRIMDETIRAGITFLDAAPRSARSVLEHHRHILLTAFGVNAVATLMTEEAENFHSSHGQSPTQIQMKVMAHKFSFLTDAMKADIASAEKTYLRAIAGLGL